ncbi:TetR/AcrR family transcriptional regulator [Nocardia sp. CDC159]|uniref:TetR/AcrR family transcriptional regulator n=1 Tax=Nocardia pulmonis TaxID=2951408 RepID=A0A9X2E9S4_9NOCA|nr:MULTISPECIES: TetR/AcrR family transcriptional regulator [Nocardia]MCM6776316.1 TetR/AcrR family transcriptional regulator [Nocardia pulmonis]MCM6788740.1 TetR/AcrR family transcriptional regulator [Nocardia sp. CDC159]
MTKSAYHHGDLRATLLRAAADQIAAEGVDAISLRALAQRAGVSHAAPAHHFGNRQGLLTALAIEGFELLGAEMRSAAGDFRDVALAYIRFARTHPGHFDIMFRRDLLRADDERLLAARERAGRSLRSGVAELGVAQQDRTATELAAWSLVHGFCALWRAGALVNSTLGGDDPEELARRMVAAVEFGGTADQR